MVTCHTSADIPDKRLLERGLRSMVGLAEQQRSALSFVSLTLPFSALLRWLTETEHRPAAESHLRSPRARDPRMNMAAFIPDENIKRFLSGQTIAQLEEAGECPALPVHARVGSSARIRNADRLFTSQPLRR